jgi:FkbM family methyltransferase
VSLISYFRKAALAGSLVRRRNVQLGDKVYRVKGLFANALAVQTVVHWQETERELERVLKSILQCREGVFLDVGANLGQTMFKILALNPHREYIGFEPQVACCFMIQRFLDENRITNFTILPVGLSNTDRLTEILSGPTDYGAVASVVDGFRPESFYSSRRYVCLKKGDDVVAELGVNSVCAIKVDVEGAELEVFEGLLNTIARDMPFLLFEVLNHFLVVTAAKLDDEMLRFRQARIEKLENLLRQQGYEIFTIHANQLNKIEKIVTVVSDDLSLTNYFAAPKSGLDKFLKAFHGV